MNYFQYVARVADAAKGLKADVNLPIVVPAAIEYAEQRIYRDLDILNARIVSTTATVTTSGRNVTLPTSQGTIIVVETMSAVSQAGARSQMVPVTKEFIDAVYPNTSTSINRTPKYFAPITDQSFLIGPPADTTYNMEIIGVIRPSPLSSANSSTFLTRYCPDLFVAASLVYVSDDKTVWEDQYQKLVATAIQENLRQRFEGAAWTPMEEAPVQPPRV